MQTMRELLDQIRRTPGMYLGTPSLTRLAAFLQGYHHGLCQHDPSRPNPFLASFEDWVLRRYPVTGARGWEYVVRSRAGADDEAAYDLFWEYLDDYLSDVGRDQEARVVNGAGQPTVQAASAQAG